MLGKEDFSEIVDNVIRHIYAYVIFKNASHNRSTLMLLKEAKLKNQAYSASGKLIKKFVEV